MKMRGFDPWKKDIALGEIYVFTDFPLRHSWGVELEEYTAWAEAARTETERLRWLEVLEFEVAREAENWEKKSRF